MHLLWECLALALATGVLRGVPLVLPEATWAVAFPYVASVPILLLYAHPRYARSGRVGLIWALAASYTEIMFACLPLMGFGVLVGLIFPIFFIVSRSSLSVDGHLPSFLRFLVGEKPGTEQLYWLGAMLVAIIALKNLASVWVYRVQTRAASDGVIRLSRRLARGYLAAPLEFHLGRKNSQYMRGLRDLPGAIYFQGALSYCSLVAEIGSVAILTLALAVFEPTGVLLALGFLGVFVFLNYRVMGGLFQHWGGRTAALLRRTYELVGQIFRA